MQCEAAWNHACRTRLPWAPVANRSKRPWQETEAALPTAAKVTTYNVTTVDGDEAAYERRDELSVLVARFSQIEG